MRRLIVPIVVAAFAVGCGERAVMPTSPLTPGAASQKAGTPPPPPISGDGFADLDVFASDDSNGQDCSASGSFTFSYQYLVNNPGKNAVLHIYLDGPGVDVAIHQTTKKIDTSGDMSGTGFTFTIKNTLGGEISNAYHPILANINLQLSGTLTLSDGTTCAANATLAATLNH